MGTRLTVVLNVADLDVSAAFYKGLGFRVRKERLEDVEYRRATWDESSLVLFPKDSPWLTDDGKEWVQDPRGRGVVLEFETSDIEKAWKRAIAVGADVEIALAEEGGDGRRAFMLDDPDGYVLVVSGTTARAAAKKAVKPRAKKAKASRSRAGSARRRRAA